MKKSMKTILTAVLFLAALLPSAAQLRTNGYSIWTEQRVAGGLSSVSGWFALESFPTDTAALLGIRDRQGRHVAVCVDRFGRLLLGSRQGYKPLAGSVNCFSWLHVVIDMDGHDVLLNGRSLQATAWEELSQHDSLTIRAGKDFTPRRGWGYDLNVINGLIDGVKANHEPVEAVILHADVGRRLQQKPRLAVPESHFGYAFSRPRYHLLPAANWTNETHGLLYFNGRYHIFNQKNASNILLRQINWGHFSSPDLVHWTEEVPALKPSEPYDRDGIWSGHAVIDGNGIPAIIYTGGSSPHSIGLAFPLDSLLTCWRKYEHNPVIADRPQAYSRTDMRDPFVFRHQDCWYMAVGFGIDSPGTPHGTLLLYKSADLKRWQHVGLLFEGNPQRDHSGRFWEMPVFLRMGKKWILSVNRVPERGLPARTQYWTGQFRHEKFVPDNALPQNLEVVNRLLSPSVCTTPGGRTIAIAIIPDEISPSANHENGWAHLYSIPRQWTFNGRKICQQPYDGLQSLRTDSLYFKQTALSQPLVISKQGWQKEIVATFHPKGKESFGITLCKNPDASEFTRIYFDQRSHELVIDQTHASLRQGIPNTVRKDAYRVAPGRSLELRLYIDGSVVEGFINGEDAFTTRIFTASEHSTQAELFASGPRTTASATVYNLMPAPVQTNF